jgi:NAD(P)-dependent dehydrogenase (short-subunit alcohol dehydrogenase family)
VSDRGFQGKVVLITGASSGIGAALAREFGRQGADLVLAARRLDRLEAVRAGLESGGRRAIVVTCDVTRDGDPDRAVAEGLERLGRIDVVVANAGFSVAGTLETLTLEDYRRQFETNVFGVLRTARAALAELRRTRGALVIMGSVSGHLAFPGSSAYSMSKFAIRALAVSLRHELAPAGVSVCLVSPGFVESEIRQVDNHGRLRPGARDTAPRWLVMPADRAARQIVAAVARRRPERIITAHGKAGVLIQRFAPWLLDVAVSRFGVRARREQGR